VGSIKKKVVIHPRYESLRRYIEEIPENFDTLGKLLEARRNVIREDEPQGIRLVIKSFKRIYLPNKIRYSFFYSSKAQRAYDNALFLMQNGFHTPPPIAYVEVKQWGLITESFFISEYIDFKALHDPGVMESIGKEILIPQLASLTYHLHQKNIFHVDYTLGNILHQVINGVNEFALVDNNRMKIGPISFERGVYNLVRLGLPDEDVVRIAEDYALLWKRTKEEGRNLILYYREKEWDKNIRKKQLKALVAPFRKKKA
jgi:hypothetical protein